MLPRLLIGLSLFLALAGCATPVVSHPVTPAAPAPRPVAVVATPCSPEAMARDMRQLSAYLFWVREGARNRLNACQGQALTATPLPPRAPTYECREVCVGYAPCRMTCRPSF